MSNVDINVDRRTDGRTDGRKIRRLYRTLLQAGAIKTVGGVALTSQLLTNGQTDGQVMACLYCTCVLTQVRQKKKKRMLQDPTGIRLVTF